MDADIALTDGDMSLYKSNYTYRGRALIIANINFKSGHSRSTAKDDISKMACMFRALDFKVTVFKDITAMAMREKIRNAAVDPHNRDSECFALVISSHGGMLEERHGSETLSRHAIYGTDGKDDLVYVDEIMSYFQDSSAPGLKGKPKLFFIQACRARMRKAGEDQGMYQAEVMDKGTLVYVKCSEGQTKTPELNLEDFIINTKYNNVNDGWMEVDKDEYNWEKELKPIIGNPDGNPHDASENERPEGPPPLPFDLVPVECMRDCIIVYAVVSGQRALRDPNYGSVLLHFLYLNARKLLHGCGLMEYLTSVASDIGKEDIVNIYKMAACIVHRLTANVSFVPKVSNSYMANVKSKNKNTNIK